MHGLPGFFVCPMLMRGMGLKVTIITSAYNASIKPPGSFQSIKDRECYTSNEHKLKKGGHKLLSTCHRNFCMDHMTPCFFYNRKKKIHVLSLQSYQALVK